MWGQRDCRFLLLNIQGLKNSRCSKRSELCPKAFTVPTPTEPSLSERRTSFNGCCPYNGFSLLPFAVVFSSVTLLRNLLYAYTRYHFFKTSYIWWHYNRKKKKRMQREVCEMQREVCGKIRRDSNLIFSSENFRSCVIIWVYYLLIRSINFH